MTLYCNTHFRFVIVPKNISSNSRNDIPIAKPNVDQIDKSKGPEVNTVPLTGTKTIRKKKTPNYIGFETNGSLGRK